MARIYAKNVYNESCLSSNKGVEGKVSKQRKRLTYGFYSFVNLK